MTAYKEKRPYTVSSIYDRRCDKDRPAIRLTGDWLRDLGFETGKKVIITCESGKLTVELEKNSPLNTQILDNLAQ